jgi:hypothetical protein
MHDRLGWPRHCYQDDVQNEKNKKHSTLIHQRHSQLHQHQIWSPTGIEFCSIWVYRPLEHSTLQYFVVFPFYLPMCFSEMLMFGGLRNVVTFIHAVFDLCDWGSIVSVEKCHDTQIDGHSYNSRSSWDVFRQRVYMPVSNLIWTRGLHILWYGHNCLSAVWQQTLWLSQFVVGAFCGVDTRPQ